MRKSIVSPSAVPTPPITEVWRDLERIARVEISSEDEQFPIEHALGKSETTGWRAAEPGPQLIRMHFDEPQNIKRIRLRFVERSAERTQEFAVFAGTASQLKEVVRQQWTFSPYGSTEEVEDYNLNLSGITTLELRIDPDRSHDPKASREYASLQSLRLA